VERALTKALHRPSYVIKGKRGMAFKGREKGAILPVNTRQKVNCGGTWEEKAPKNGDTRTGKASLVSNRTILDERIMTGGGKDSTERGKGFL